jgi:predicted restriction endonuclease
LQACKVCGYTFCVQCCHIKSVSSFPRTTPLSVVNDLSNLVGLCPNHHVELDRGHLLL